MALLLLPFIALGIWILFQNAQRPDPPSYRQPYLSYSRTSGSTDPNMAGNMLASALIAAVNTFTGKSEIEYLNKNKVTVADTVFYSAFVVRAFVLSSASRGSAVDQFDRGFLSQIQRQIAEIVPLSVAQPLYDNRSEFYDRVMRKHSNLGDGIGAVTTEFEFVIKSDIINDGFQPFSESSPLPVLGFTDDKMCELEINRYFPYLLECLKPLMQIAIEQIS